MGTELNGNVAIDKKQKAEGQYLEYNWSNRIFFYVVIVWPLVEFFKSKKRKLCLSGRCFTEISKVNRSFIRSFNITGKPNVLHELTADDTIVKARKGYNYIM